MDEYESLVYTGYTPFDPVYEQYLWDQAGLEQLEQEQYEETEDEDRVHTSDR